MLQALRLAPVFLILLACIYPTWSSSAACKKKEKSLASLSIAKESIERAKELYPNCTNSIRNSTRPGCGTKEKSFGYLDVAVNLISSALQNYPTCSGDDEEKNKTLKHVRPLDCSQVLENGYNASRVYTIWLNGDVTKPLQVFCDMDTAGGGWTVIQRRGNYPVQEDFYRDWATYKKGFGNISRDFWIGNDNLFALTNQASYSIRFDLEDSKGGKAYAVYRTFKIEDETSRYKLSIDGYSGNASDSMSPTHDGKQFFTKDKDTSNTCSSSYHGGWWYGYGGGYNCYGANLNGRYRSDVYWLAWKSNESLGTVQMKLKRT